MIDPQQNLSSAEPVREGEKPVERRAKRKSSGSFYMPFRRLNRKRSNFPRAEIKLDAEMNHAAK
jgi:hypothetical protein